MNDTARFVAFLAVVLGTWTLMHVYAISRAWGLLPAGIPRRAMLLAAILLWLSFPVARILAHQGFKFLSSALEAVGSVWIGVLFFCIVCLLAADLVTGFGYLLPQVAALARKMAFLASFGLSVLAVAQGLRSPSVHAEDVVLPGLPKELDGTRLVQLSDLHLGTLLGERWLDGVITQVQALHPDILVVTGDLVDGEAGAVEPLLPHLRRLKAPLGVWAVTGNHEFYAGIERCTALMENAGFHVLRDSWEEAAPGLTVAGVDDLTARRQFGKKDQAVEQALSGRPPGAAIFLCHSPLQVEKAASLGAGLMLSGHTHGGQIWPFVHLVALFYPRVEGRYTVGSMTLIVSRGTGTWGPPMRLFRRSEILLVTLRHA